MIVSSEKLRVLVLEDNPVQAAQFDRILRAAHFSPVLMEDPLELLHGLDTLAVPAAILLDIILPEVDGIAVLATLESHPRWCLVPVVLMTASPTRDRVEAAQKLPVPPEGFLVKPIEPEPMIQLLHAVLAAREPVLMLRALQRKRLSLRLGLREDLEGLEEALRDSQRVFEESERKLSELRTEGKNLRMAEALIHDAPLETRNALKKRIRVVDEGAAAHIRRLQESGANRKLLLQKRQVILTKQKIICNLEHKIQALAQAMRGMTARTPAAK